MLDGVFDRWLAGRDALAVATVAGGVDARTAVAATVAAAVVAIVAVRLCLFSLTLLSCWFSWCVCQCFVPDPSLDRREWAGCLGGSLFSLVGGAVNMFFMAEPNIGITYCCTQLQN